MAKGIIEKSDVAKINNHGKHCYVNDVQSTKKSTKISYNSEFIFKIKRGQMEFANSGGTTIQLKNLWK